ncbi:MAG: hypothetical protein M0R31_05445 [Candidatus Riflebacteria bacterium]|nr:hypothetical protein [Candidatus Riflebacteria bacterium]
MKKIIAGITIFGALLMAPQAGHTCDDALVMLLTAQNPGSEFSKTIRGFTTNLTILGSSLKNNTNPPYEKELGDVMNSWLQFSSSYMTNPPEEAKNDVNWVKKMSASAKLIGVIRKLVMQKEYMPAHDKVLELSSTLGAFFEGFGISDEKQMFIRASAELLDLQRFVMANDYSSAKNSKQKIKAVLEDFRLALPADKSAQTAFDKALTVNEIVFEKIEKNEPVKTVDENIQELQLYVEQLRSLILMQEWFPKTSKIILEEK